MKFQSLKTSKLNKNQIKQILKLKNTYWKHTLISQKKWFKKNAKSRDLHNIVSINNNIIGYTFLGFRSFKNTKSKKKLKYLLFATLILKKKYRNFFYASKIMKFNNKIILKNKKLSLLLCKKSKIKFYKFFGWFKIKKSYFNVVDHPHRLIGMIYNFRTLKNKIKQGNKFYYYS